METKIDPEQAQLDIDILCDRDVLNRKLCGLTYPHLREHTAQILLWAHSDRSSKRKVARLVTQKLGLIVSPDQVHRFVKSINGGVWPHHRVQKMEKK